MATIKSQLVLTDNMTAPLRSIYKAMNMVLNSFESMQRASGNAVDLKTWQGMLEELAKGNAALDEMEKKTKKVSDAADGTQFNFRKAAEAFGAIRAAKRITEVSDNLSSTRARLNLIVDDGGSVEELEKKIYHSAQSARANYLDTMSAVAKLGQVAKDAFTSNDEMIKFSELVNKNFVVGGASATEQASAMYQLTQAMSSGRLQGDEYRSIIENAPLLAKSIEDYMRNVKGATGSMKEWASEGLLTAGVIKAAVFESAGDVEKAFDNVPMTWGQVWTMMGNIAIRVFKPILTAISWLAQNISIIAPLVMGVGAAFLVFQVAAHWTQIAAVATAIYQGVVNFLSIGFGVLRGSTAAASAAVHTFNSALLASPITWILMIIIAVIAAVYAVVAAINKWKGTTISATGVIVGALAAAVAFIWNLLLLLLDFVLGIVNAIANPWISFANFFANIFNDPIATIIHHFGDLADSVLSVIETIAKGIDKVFGSNLAGVVQGWRSGLDSMVENAANKYGNGSYEEVAENLNLSSESLGLKRWEYSDAWNSGYTWGDNMGDSLSGMFNTDDLLGDIGSDTSSIADSAGSAASALAGTTEDLKYMRDLAEQEAINRFTTAEVKIDMTGMTNRIDSGMDLDGVLTVLTDGFAEALETAAEGVHV